MSIRISEPSADLREQPERPEGALAADDALALLAHDLRGALTVVRGFARTLQERWDRMEAAQVCASLDAIVVRTDDVLAFAEDLIDMARAEAGRLELHPQPLDLTGVLTDSIAKARRDHPAYSFDLRLAGPPLIARADARRIGQVLTNLLTNAVKNAPPGSVKIEATAQRGQILVAISDHGPGVEEAAKQHLFEKFPPGRTRGSSVGLGLYLCRLLVEAHGGRIWMNGSAGATTFSFALPAGGNTSEGR